ncbi:hypothetical protein OIE62_07185 [Streptomyces scopuliridis]|uniref:Uncharacterized protein n=1 Tax=Streptomyces scopuliridis TaxID=452529 RepID=A0ACD4ZTY9_9ACTN|nr:hypothetical protein [Streptomyces scopuliridis]WSC01641.1 hypothetical protein OG835_34635 [Streptomyces scopuliridis]WSC04820.1 hypothetical protein OIE62_07185 [Streptomyces scopuliridis]
MPTGGFADDDVPRRQDLILANPTVANALYGYTVHMEPIADGMSDHVAVSVWLSLSGRSTELRGIRAHEVPVVPEISVPDSNMKAFHRARWGRHNGLEVDRFP